MPNFYKTAYPILLANVFVGSVLLSPSADAHHSFGMFDDKQCPYVEGVVKKFEFVYPHVWLWIESEDSDGTQSLWGLVGADPATLAQYGWSQESVKKGEEITVWFNPLSDGRKGGSMRHVKLSKGETVSAQGDEKFFAKCLPTI